MAYGSLLTDTVQSSTTGTPPQFNDGNGTQIGTLCRAWVNFQGGNGNTAGTINRSFNVSSITVVGTGQYTVNFTTAMPNANFVTIAAGRIDYSGSFDNSIGGLSRVQPTTTTTQVVYESTSGTGLNCREMDVLVVGG